MRIHLFKSGNLPKQIEVQIFNNEHIEFSGYIIFETQYTRTIVSHIHVNIHILRIPLNSLWVKN